MSLYSSIMRNTALRFILAREGRGKALGYWRDLEKSQWWDSQRLLDYQWSRLQSLLAHAYKHTAFYRRIMDERGLTPASFKSLDDLKQLPVLTRQMIEEHRGELFADNYDRDSLIPFGSGGTTTKRLELYRDRDSHVYKIGIAWRFEGFMGRKPCDTMAYLWPPPVDFHHAASPRYEWRVRHVDREFMYYTGAATDEVMRSYYDELMQHQPLHIKCFPSGLERLCDFMDTHALDAPRTEGILSTGEVINAKQRERFEYMLGAPVIDMYGSREVGNTACECVHQQGLHISSESSVVEVLLNGESVPLGEEGEIIVTDLTNYGFPLIRYALEDFGTLIDSECTCGRALPLMSPGVGRLSDYMIRPDGTKYSGLAFGVIMSESEHSTGKIQVIQEDFRRFRVRVTDDPPPTEALKAHLRESVDTVMKTEVETIIEVVSELPKEKSGKIRFFKCEIDRKDAPVESEESTD